MTDCIGRPFDPPRAFERPLSLTPRKPKFVTQFSVHCPKPVHGPDDSKEWGAMIATLAKRPGVALDSIRVDQDRANRG
jgi:hypothetical protein